MIAPLRLYDGSPADAPLTLRRAYQLHLEPDHKPPNVISYGASLSLWERFTDDPDVDSITDEMLSVFRDRLVAENYAPAYINKTWRNLRAIFRRLLGRGYRNPRGKGLLDTMPCLDTMPEDDEIKRYVLPDEFGAMYSAANVATWPQVPNPPQWWRSLLVLAYCHGMRVSDLTPLKGEHPGLRWTHVVDAARFPKPGIALNHEHGWLVFTPHKTRDKKPGKLYLPLVEAARRHLEMMRGIDETHVFPCGRSQKSFRQTMRLICEAADIEPCTPQDVRRSCSSNYDYVDGGLGEWVLGQAPRTVNNRFYTTIVRRLIRAAKKYELPEIVQHAGRSNERQLTLF